MGSCGDLWGSCGDFVGMMWGHSPWPENPYAVKCDCFPPFKMYLMGGKTNTHKYIDCKSHTYQAR